MIDETAEAPQGITASVAPACITLAGTVGLYDLSWLPLTVEQARALRDSLNDALAEVDAA